MEINTKELKSGPFYLIYEYFACSFSDGGWVKSYKIFGSYDEAARLRKRLLKDSDYRLISQVLTVCEEK